MTNKLFCTSLTWYVTSLLIVFLMPSVWAQGTASQKLVLNIVSKRQKSFNKTKNLKISCEEMKNDMMKKFANSGDRLEGLDPMEDAQARKYLKCPQTDWESVLERSAVELYKDQIIAGITKLGITSPKNIMWAPNRCPCYNASANYLGTNNKLLKNNWIIEINTSLDIETGEYAKIAALSTPVIEEGGVVKIDSNYNSYIDRLSDNPDIFKEFMMRLLSNLLNDPVLGEKSIQIGQPHLSLYAMYSQYAQIFALSHEISHVLLNHQGVQKGLVVSRDKKESKISYTSFTDGISKNLAYKQEFAADSLGLEIMLAVADVNYNNPSNGTLPDIKIKLFGIYGAEMLLTWMEMFQSAEVVTYGNYNGSESHPPASARRDKIRSILQKKGMIKEQSDFGKSTYLAMNLMWSKFKPQLDGTMAQKIKSIKKTANCRSND